MPRPGGIIALVGERESAPRRASRIAATTLALTTMFSSSVVANESGNPPSLPTQETTNITLAEGVVEREQIPEGYEDFYDILSEYVHESSEPEFWSGLRTKLTSPEWQDYFERESKDVPEDNKKDGVLFSYHPNGIGPKPSLQMHIENNNIIEGMEFRKFFLEFWLGNEGTIGSYNEKGDIFFDYNTFQHLSLINYLRVYIDDNDHFTGNWNPEHFPVPTVAREFNYVSGDNEILTNAREQAGMDFDRGGIRIELDSVYPRPILLSEIEQPEDSTVNFPVTDEFYDFLSVDGIFVQDEERALV